jgi:hypothetical protein
MLKKINQDNSGFGHILYVGLVVLVLVIIGLVGWKIIGKNKTPSNSNGNSNTSTSSSSNGVSSSCLSTYHDNNLCHFSDSSNNFSKTSYTATITEVQNGATSTMTLENDGKGNTKLTGTSNGSTINSISLNGKTYIQNNGSGPWIEYSTGSNASTTDPTSNMNIGVGSSGITFKYLGTQSCSGLTCFKYSVADSVSPGATQYVLFDNSSYKLREWQYTDSSGSSTTMTVSYGTVNITTPSPVQAL